MLASRFIMSTFHSLARFEMLEECKHSDRHYYMHVADYVYERTARKVQRIKPVEPLQDKNKNPAQGNVLPVGSRPSGNRFGS